MSKLVHLAGTPIVLDERIIQRCLICGEKLCDSLNAEMLIEKEHEKPIFPVWGVGAWIEIEGNRSSVVGIAPEPEIKSENIPENCCLVLVEN